MKLGRFTPCAQIPIRKPRWKERTVGIASFRIKEHNAIIIEYKKADGTRLYPYHLYMSGDRIRQYPVQKLKSGVVLYLVPIADLEVLERV